MRSCLLLLLLLSMTGCEGPRPPVVLESHPKVDFGADLDPAAEVWTVGKDGILLRSGKKSSLDEARSLPRERDSDPILIEISPGSTVDSCVPLLNSLMNSRRGNISFAVSTAKGPRCVVLPILRALGQVLVYRVGSKEFRDSSENTKHLIILCRVDSSIGCRVESLAHCSYSDLDAIEFPDVKEGTGETTPTSRSAKPAPWPGKHPPLGAWTLNTLREFMTAPEIQILSPLVILEVEPKDEIQNVLGCLDMLHQVAFGKTVVHIPQPR